MTCDEVRRELVAYVRAELDGADTQAVSAHLGKCSACTREHERMAETLELVAASSAPSPRPELRASVMAAVAAENMAAQLKRAVPALPPEDLKARVMSEVHNHSKVVAPISSARSFSLRQAVFSAAAALLLIFAGVTWMQLQDARRDLSDRDEIDVAAPGTDGLPTGHDLQEVVLEGDVRTEATLNHYRHDNYRIELSTDGFPVTPPGFQYSVWLRGEAGDVPLGGFRLKKPDEFTVPFAVAVDPKLYPEVVVTLEPIEGTPALEGEIINSASLDPDSVHHGVYDE